MWCAECGALRVKRGVWQLPRNTPPAPSAPRTPIRTIRLGTYAAPSTRSAADIEREERQHARTMALMDEHFGGTESHSVGLSGDDD